MAIGHNEKLRAIYDAECQCGDKNRAILEVARRLVKWLLAIDRRYFASRNSVAVAA